MNRLAYIEGISIEDTSPAGWNLASTVAHVLQSLPTGDRRELAMRLSRGIYIGDVAQPGAVATLSDARLTLHASAIASMSAFTAARTIAGELAKVIAPQTPSAVENAWGYGRVAEGRRERVLATAESLLQGHRYSESLKMVIQAELPSPQFDESAAAALIAGKTAELDALHAAQEEELAFDALLGSSNEDSQLLAIDLDDEVQIPESLARYGRDHVAVASSGQRVSSGTARSHSFAVVTGQELVTVPETLAAYGQ